MEGLCVCTGNVVRSPMAEMVVGELTGGDRPHEGRSTGTGTGAVRRLTTWSSPGAHASRRIESGWPDQAHTVRVLDVPGDDDPEAPERRALADGARIGERLKGLGLNRPTIRTPAATRASAGVAWSRGTCQAEAEGDVTGRPYRLGLDEVGWGCLRRGVGGGGEIAKQIGPAGAQAGEAARTRPHWPRANGRPVRPGQLVVTP